MASTPRARSSSRKKITQEHRPSSDLDRREREGCAMQWNGQSGVREFRIVPNGKPDSHAPDEAPKRICIGEICEPMS